MPIPPATRFSVDSSCQMNTRFRLNLRQYLRALQLNVLIGDIWGIPLESLKTPNPRHHKQPDTSAGNAPKCITALKTPKCQMQASSMYRYVVTALMNCFTATLLHLLKHRITFWHFKYFYHCFFVPGQTCVWRGRWRWSPRGSHVCRPSHAWSKCGSRAVWDSHGAWGTSEGEQCPSFFKSCLLCALCSHKLRLCACTNTPTLTCRGCCALLKLWLEESIH